MKNLNERILVTIILLFAGIGIADAQEKSSVIITGYTYNNQSKYKIEIVKPDYEVEKKESSIQDANFFSLMKKEVDLWLSRDFELIESTSNSLGPGDQRILFVLVKEE